LIWTITELGGIQYKVRFENAQASDKFAVLANFWTSAPISGGYNINLRAVVLRFAGSSWESVETAFAEIDTFTATFALFDSV